jgi:ADP-heptose:LPS heptosyltransferase
MHILTLLEKLELTVGAVYESGEYYTFDHNGAQMMNIAGGGKMRPASNTKPFDETKDWNGKTLCFVRPGGFGDIVLLTPVLKEFKRRWPGCRIVVSCMKLYSAVLRNLPFVDDTADYPIAKSKMDGYDAWILFEDAIEKNPRAEKLHMTDLFAEIAGLTAAPDTKVVLASPQAEYVITPNERIWAQEAYPRVEGMRRACIQPGASALCRSYPGDKWMDVIKGLLDRNYEVFVLGRPEEFGKKPEHTVPHLHDLWSKNTTFRQSCAVVGSADVFIGNDSSLLHIAGALNIPAVGLYAAFLATLRTAYAPFTFAIQAAGPCAPCFHHMNPARQNHLPMNCPSRDKGICQVLASIEPKRILAKAEQIGKKLP